MIFAVLERHSDVIPPSAMIVRIDCTTPVYLGADPPEVIFSVYHDRISCEIEKLETKLIEYFCKRKMCFVHLHEFTCIRILTLSIGATTVREHMPAIPPAANCDG